MTFVTQMVPRKTTAKGHLRVSPSIEERTSARARTSRLKAKPRYGEVHARDHRERGHYPQPPRPEPPCPSLGQQGCNKADHERSQRGRDGPAVPVDRGSQE